MKKVLSALLAVIMFASFIPVVSAANTKVTFSVDTIAECNQGTTDLSVYIHISNTPNWGALELTVNFDNEKLKFNSCVLNPELRLQDSDGTNMYMTDNKKLNEGKFFISFASVSTKGGYEGYYPGEYDYFAVLSFDVYEEAQTGFTPISLQVRTLAVIVDDEAVNVESSVTNGGIGITCFHNWKLIGHMDATCDNDGYDQYLCKKCNEKKTDILDRIGHSWGEWTVDREATCSEVGQKSRVCKNDPAHVDTAEIPINPDAHQWGKWELTREATCSAPGIETRYCQNDKDHFETRETQINPEAHDWVVSGRMDATCENDGWVEYVCSHDKTHVKRETIHKRGHNWGEWTETRTPTCSVPGQETRVCINDPSHIETRNTKLDLSAHDWGEWGVTKEATCATPGEETRYCKSNPNHFETRQTNINPEAHDWSEWQETKPATYEEDGEMQRYCINNPEHKETKPIPALKHTFGEWQVTKEATCTEEGEETRYCIDDGCSCSETRSIPKLGHDWGEWAVTKAATCSTTGEETRVCKNDPSHKETRIIPIDPDAHDWGEWEITDYPTCSKSGIETRVCKNDPTHIETREIPIDEDAHVWGNWYITKEPTYDEEGEETRECLVNHEHKETRVIPKLEREYTLGDFDNDGSITVADALAALRIAAKLVAEDDTSIAIGDIDGDKHVTVADALAILRVAAKLVEHL